MSARQWIMAACVGHCSLVLAQLDPAIAQKEPRGVEQELGINMVSWINVDVENAFHGDGDIRYVNGLLYKLHCGRNAWRAGVDVFRDSYVIGTSMGEGGDYPSNHGYREGCSSDARVRLGYQRSFGTCDLKPFAGVDVGFRYVKGHYDFEGNGDFIYNPTWGSGSNTTELLFIAPLFGMNYRPTVHWSFAVEAAFTWSKGRSEDERTERSHMLPDEHTYSYSKEVKGMLVDPLRTVAVSYHF